MSLLDSFIVNSDYPADKIVWTAEGTDDPTNPYWSEDRRYILFLPIEQSLTIESFLIDGVWTNDDWRTQYPINTNSRIMGWKHVDDNGYYMDYDTLYADVYANGTNFFQHTVPYQSVVVYGGSSSSRTFKYRLWAYSMESDWKSYSETRTAETLASKLQLNTDLAQLNMISETILAVPSGQTRTLYHNLGFRPYCKIWSRDTGYTEGVTWRKNNLRTVFDPSNTNRLDKITIDEEKITIYAEDVYFGDEQDFLIRIFNYAIPS